MIFVPVLRCPVIRYEGEHRARGTLPITRKNRFPHDEDAQFLAPELLQKLLRCGGPPHTSRSGWRKQQKYAGLVCRLIELPFEVADILGNNIRQRDLTSRRAVPDKLPQDKCNHDRNGKCNERSLSHQLHLASTIAISCGNRKIISTRAAAIHNRIMLARLRIWHDFGER